ncbi:MAG TPA: NADH-quinone oxidoreductase subunit L [Polyangiales bacterium]|nr:NADH-quinone oxidoreductase subunit L [Polyangiales bacterium]
MHEKALLFIVLFPLIGAIVNGLFGRRAGRPAVHAIAVMSVAASFGFALYAFVHLYQMRLAHDEEAAIRYTAWEWFSVAIYDRTIPVNVRFVMDSLSGVMTLIVTGIGLLIHIYSTGYMSEEKSYARFFAYLNLFMASMLVLVLGSSFPVLFVGWEGVGVCSYLLIGFWFENENYAKAGRKAFVANRIGDFGVLVGMFILAAVVHSFEFERINEFAREHAGVLTSALRLGPGGQPYLMISGVTVATAATLFLFLGCTGKSAQLPLYVWLPDAMAGPTPVSALIHAATMVTSGLYLICRLSPVFALAPISMAVIAVTGALTALLAASVGLVQNEIKKILAYSTVSQLGFMFAAVGCGAFAAGFMHVYTHAFFKACLFLGAGSVMHAVGAHGDADIRTLGGLRKYMPSTHWTFFVSCLAIAGFPFLSGFYSKDEILVGALSVDGYFSFAPWLGKLVFAMLVVGATMTAFYMFRLYFLTFSGEFRGGPHHDDHGHAADHDDHHDDHAHEPHESPLSMTVPLMILGVGAIFAGYVWVGLVHFEPWVIWLEPALGSIGVEHAHSAPIIALVCGTAAAALGIGTAWVWYYKGSATPARLAKQFPGLHALLMDKWRLDEFYDATILAASRLLGRFLAAYDKWVVDGILSEVTSQTLKASSFLFTRMQNGLVHAYGTAMAVGMLALTFYFIVPHAKPELSTDSSGYKAKLTADKGLSYEYRWDFDGDGQFDTDWGAEPAVEHEFSPGDIKAYAVVFEAAALGRLGGSPAPEVLPLESGKSIKLSEGQLGPTWQSTAGGPLPRVVAEDDGVVIEANGARVRKDGQLAKGSVRVKRGEYANIGEARLTVTGLVHARMAVRNAFGMERVRTLSLEMPKVEPRGQARVAGLVGAAK